MTNKQDKDINIQEMNERLKFILQGMYKFQEQIPDIKMFMAYANDKGVYINDGEFLNYEDSADTESIKHVIEYEKNKKSVLKEEIAAVDSLVKDNGSGLLKDLLLSSAGALCAVMPSNLLLTAGAAITSGFLLKNFVTYKSKAGGKAEETETAEMQKDDARFRAVWYWIERTLQNSRRTKNCYVPSYTVLHDYKDQECLQFCVFQLGREINLNAEKYSFLTTMLNLFACYIFFPGLYLLGTEGYGIGCGMMRPLF